MKAVGPGADQSIVRSIRCIGTPVSSPLVRCVASTRVHAISPINASSAVWEVWGQRVDQAEESRAEPWWGRSNHEITGPAQDRAQMITSEPREASCMFINPHVPAVTSIRGCVRPDPISRAAEVPSAGPRATTLPPSSSQPTPSKA
ncbi:hypothetical protein NDU88_001619 [Pleurodeles waltl]|uniref:Uncharacterized protein n=1 Tax=Pleurodeles waltl TaxID=8319 RepID=A0AAV7NG96_PLEWA|nr:hypothetical protein NDU88_001619 [Pleurodeles waltl]